MSQENKNKRSKGTPDSSQPPASPPASPDVRPPASPPVPDVRPPARSPVRDDDIERLRRENEELRAANQILEREKVQQQKN